MNYFKLLLLLCFILACVVNTSAQQEAIISGHLDFGSPDAKISLIVCKNESRRTTSHFDTTFSQCLDNRKFQFKVPIQQEPKYVKILFEEKTQRLDNGVGLGAFYVRKGDSICFHADENRTLTFLGKTKSRMQLVFELTKLESVVTQHFIVDPRTYFDQYKNNLARGKELIRLAGGTIDSVDLCLIEADFIGYMNRGLYGTFALTRFGSGQSDAYGKIGKQVYKEFLYRTPEDTTDAVLSQSLSYAGSLMEKTLADVRYDTLVQGARVDAVQFLCEKYAPGVLRDRILSSYLFRSNKHMFDRFQAAKPYIVTPKYKQIWDDFGKPYEESSIFDDPATFINPKGNRVTMADFKGKVVLLDLWFSGCPSCVPIAQAMPMVEKAFEDRDDVVFISFSGDSEIETWLRSIKKTKDHSKREGLFFMTDRSVYLNINGSLKENKFLAKYNPTSRYPTLLLIDKQGRIVKDTPPDPQKNQGRDLIAFIQRVLDQKME